MVRFFSVYSFVVVAYLAIFVLLGLLSQHSRRHTWALADVVNGGMTIALTAMGWMYTSTSTVDLDRMMQETEQARLFGASYLFDLYGSNPLSVVILMIGYVTGDQRYLQMFGVFVTYGLFFTIAGILRRALRVDPVLEAIGATIVLFGFSFVTAATNIRFWIAVNLILLGITVHECLGKRVLCVVLIAAGLLTHTGTIIIIIIYMAAMVLGTKLFTAFCAVLLMYSSVAEIIQPLLSSSSIPFVSQIGDKIGIYYNVGDGVNYDNTYDAQMIEANGRNSPMIMVTTAAVMFALYWLTRKVTRRHLPATVEKLMLATFCFVYGSYNSYTVFVRYALFGMILVIPALYSSLQHYFSGISQNTLISDQRSLNQLARHALLPVALFLFYVLLRRDMSYVYWSSYLSMF